MITMKGAAVSAKLKEQVEKGLETLTWVPKLTIIRVGENPDDISYEKGATKKLTSFGLEVESKVFPGFQSLIVILENSTVYKTLTSSSLERR